MTESDEAVSAFRAKVQDILRPEHDDFELKKWLKARCYNLNEAEKMFRNSMAYKEKNNVADLIKDYKSPEVLQKYLAGGLVGHAKDGSTLRVELYGKLDMKGLMNSVKKSDLEKTKLLHCEATVADWKTRSEQTGTKIDGLTVIFDMEGVGTHMLWKPGIQMYLYMVQILEDNYPEMLKKLLVINAPGIFPILYKLCKPLISKDTKNKIEVLGGNYQQCLKKYIEDEQLPACYGGTLTDPDGNPRCVTMICQGGTVPEEYYTQNTDYLDTMENTTIEKGDKLIKEYIINIPGSVLRWEFMTQNHDIEFGVFFKNDSAKEAIVPMSRINSHTITEDGFVTCEKNGVYEIVFSNASWFSDKVVYYNIEVLTP